MATLLAHQRLRATMIDPDHEIQEIRAAQRDPAAFAPLYERYVDNVWRFAMARVRDVELASDLTSLTFERALRRLPEFRPQRIPEGTTLLPWLLGIARNASIDHGRRRRDVVPWQALPIRHEPRATDPSPDAHAVSMDERQRVHIAMDTLSDQQRTIVHMRLAGASGREIGAALGISENAVKASYHRAIVRLRDALRDLDINERSAE